MLDAFIIERIRQQRRAREAAQVPLRIERPDLEDEPRRDTGRDSRPDSDRDRGIVIVDYSVAGC